MKVKIKRIQTGYGDVALPQYQTEGASGMDVCAAIDKPIIIKAGQACKIPTNIAIAVPKGYECQVRGRSGLAFKSGIFGFYGTVDSDYRGEIGVLLENHSDKDFEVTRGMRVAQLVIAPVEKVETVEVPELDETTRNTGGFGSTGK